MIFDVEEPTVPPAGPIVISTGTHEIHVHTRSPVAAKRSSSGGFFLLFVGLFLVLGALSMTGVFRPIGLHFSPVQTKTAH